MCEGLKSETIERVKNEEKSSAALMTSKYSLVSL